MTPEQLTPEREQELRKLCDMGESPWIADVRDLLAELDRVRAANTVTLTEREVSAALLLRADICCNNGCGCEEYDYCAADEWDNARVRALASAADQEAALGEGNT